MYTTYHLSSAEEVPSIVEAIILAHKSKAITITVEENEEDELTEEQKHILDERLAEDEDDYLTAEESIKQLKSEYGL